MLRRTVAALAATFLAIAGLPAAATATPSVVSPEVMDRLDQAETARFVVGLPPAPT
jgi:hypothetical protein